MSMSSGSVCRKSLIFTVSLEIDVPIPLTVIADGYGPAGAPGSVLVGAPVDGGFGSRITFALLNVVCAVARALSSASTSSTIDAASAGDVGYVALPSTLERWRLIR